ncbi:MAG: hypothetical protein LBR84_09215 [Tannerella sp.]|jgi:hypothetical protein|nr:hypothetical protein [Tannerella sp.]
MKPSDDMKNPIPLLLTGSIAIEKYNVFQTVLVDTQVRLNQYIDSIEYAIVKYNNINHIIFCENTNFEYDYSELVSKAYKRGKTLEIIRFTGDYKNIQRKGKGYGEGEIVKYAIENSEILNSSLCFIKLTGRVLVKNMDKCIETTKNETAFLFGPPHSKKNFVQTIIYKVNTKFYYNVLLNVYFQVNDPEGYCLEHAFYEALKKYPIKSFGRYPDLDGTSGSVGYSYLMPRKEYLKATVYNMIGFYNNKI